MEKLQCMFLKIGGETPLETLVNDRFLPILMANFEKKWEWPVIYRPNGRDEAFIIPKTSHTVDSRIIFGKIVWLWPVQNQKPAAASKYEWEDSGAKLPPFCLHILHAPIPSKTVGSSTTSLLTTKTFHSFDSAEKTGQKSIKWHQIFAKGRFF